MVVTRSVRTLRAEKQYRLSSGFRRNMRWLSRWVENQYQAVYEVAFSPKLVSSLFDLAQLAIQLGGLGSEGGKDMWLCHTP